ncbi:programmed cell death protein 1 isoform X1 [Bos indicus]|uniref:Ig-like domain-containing protein n=2 Tax=Bos TaxID=9903 RepID=A0A4W2DRH5_BOBOX|nr:programmed cell death protein 1 isoform X1 [Bos taurus]
MGTPRALWPLVWAVLQLGCWPGWLLEASSRPWSALTFSPPRLVVPEGANATFTCSFSSKPERFVLNWYRKSPSNQMDKLAAFPEDRSQPSRDRRFRVTPLPDGQQFNMSIVAAQRNDSGVYFCGAIYLPPRTQINESHSAELMVTEAVLEPPTEPPSPQPRPEGQMQSLVIGVTSVLLGVLLLPPLIWVLAAVFLRATREGGLPLCAGCHSGLRGAGLPVAGEDPGARGSLRPGADRVRHHRLPRPQGVRRQPAGALATEDRGWTLLLAPLTGFTGWAESFRPSAQSQG